MAKTKWYLYTDGKSIRIANSLTEIGALKGVIINITADEAAKILSLQVESANGSEVTEV